MAVLLEKIKEVSFSVIPITIIVLILNFTFAPLTFTLLFRFILGAITIILGLSILLFGIDIGITQLGKNVGSSISKTNKLHVVVIIGLILGFFISVAEPDLQILASQIESVTSGGVAGYVIIIVVSAGFAALLVTGLIRIYYNIPLYKMLAVIYGLIGILSIFVSPEFLAIGFDASGATTGALTVPFILALALGISSMKKDSKASEKDSFGLVGVTSSGVILAVLIMGIVKNIGDLTGVLPKNSFNDSHLLSSFTSIFPKIALEGVFALLPILLICIFFQYRYFKLSKAAFAKMLKGILYSCIGLILFLLGVNAGFMDVGAAMGSKIAESDFKGLAIIIGFVLGLATILAEPAVHILTDQIETVTSGSIKRKTVLASLSIGVGSAVALSIVRVLVPSLQLWHYLLPGYLISVGLSFFVPKLFVGIAFDAGGVASGPITATFLLAFTQGVSDSIPSADVLKDAFGMIALVAMTPVITLQILGLIMKIKQERMVKRNGSK